MLPDLRQAVTSITWPLCKKLPQQGSVTLTDRLRGAGVRAAQQGRDARSEEHAYHHVKHTAARKGGATVIALALDTESGEVSKATILARFGAVPDDLDQFVESF
jgi:hypothetical protein